MIPKNAARALLRYSEAVRRLGQLELASLHGRPIEAKRFEEARATVVETREAVVEEIAKVESEAATLLTAIAAKGGL